MEIIEITAENIDNYGVFCSKNLKGEGFKAKRDWYLKQFELGWRLSIAVRDSKQIGFIEYGPVEFAWRPISGKRLYFIQCLMVQSKSDRMKGIASKLIEHVREHAKSQEAKGLCTFSSKGTWMASSEVFLKNHFEHIASKDRFELLFESFDQTAQAPRFLDWEKQLSQYDTGWHLLYANQCPWHIKSVEDLKRTARMHDVILNDWEIRSAEEVKTSPMGFGVFALIKDGKLLEDHYISATRFKNILKKELG